MPRYRSTYMIAPPKSSLPPGFFELRDQFRDRDLDLFREGPIRFIARAGAETFGPWRSVAEARQWLEARPVQTLGRRAR